MSVGYDAFDDPYAYKGTTTLKGKIVVKNDASAIQQELTAGLLAQIDKNANKDQCLAGSEEEKTEQELKREDEARNVEEVWTRGAGTSLHINYLFIALARAAGLQATGVLVPTRN